MIEKNKTLIKALQKIHDLGNTRSGKSIESRIAYETLTRLNLPLKAKEKQNGTQQE